MSYNNAFIDNFNRADGAVGNGWLGTSRNISGNTVVLNQGATNPWNDPLYRPDTEDHTSQKVVITTQANGGASGVYATLRLQDANDAYVLGLSITSAMRVRIHRNVAGTLSAALAAGSDVTHDATKSYIITATAEGVSPTVLTVTIADAAAPSTILSTATFNDSEAQFQAAGSIGMFAAGTRNVDSVEYTSQDTPVTLDATDAAVVKSPYNWRTDGTELQAWNAGAYLRCYFNGYGCKVNFDQTGVTQDATVLYRIDGGAWSSPNLIEPATTELEIAGFNHATTEHVVEIMLDLTEQAGNRWNGVDNVLRVTGFNIAYGTASAATTEPRRAIIYGDSIVEGSYASLGGTTSHEPTYANKAAQLLRTMGFEVGIVSCSGGGWTVTNLGVPAGYKPNFPLTDWWDAIDTATARYTADAGWTDGAPHLVITQWGTNDAIQAKTDSEVLASVQGFIRDVRAGSPDCLIILSVPHLQYKQSVLAQAVTEAATGAVALLDMGAVYSGYDVHPTHANHITISADFNARLLAILAADVPAASGAMNPVLNWDMVTGAVSYNIYRDGVFLDNTTANSYTDTTAAGATYDYTVRAVTATGDEADLSAAVRVSASVMALFKH